MSHPINNLTDVNINTNKTFLTQFLSEHFPNETPTSILDRIQSLLHFVNEISELNPKLLMPKAQNSSLGALNTQAPILFSNKALAAHPNYHLTKLLNLNLDLNNVEKTRSTLLSQITEINNIHHLIPSMNRANTSQAMLTANKKHR